jgi:hypothetical protein
MVRYTLRKQRQMQRSTTINKTHNTVVNEDGILQGYVTKDASSWVAQTIFHYTIERTNTEADAEKIVHKKGLSFLTGVWQYFDKDDRAWFPCVVKEAYETKVVVIRTNELGYQVPEDYKQLTIERPDESVLVKSS